MTSLSLSHLKHHWREVFFLLLLVWILGSQAYKSGINPDSALTGLDFRVYYNAAQRLNTDKPLYLPSVKVEDGPYIYLPLTAIATQPLAKLPQDQAFKIWTAINILCLFGAIALFARTANFRWQDSLAIGIILLISFRFWPTLSNLALGQINLITLLLISAMYYAQSKGKWAYIGLLIAVAAMFKTWMIGLLFYLVLQRQWRAALWCLITFLLLIVSTFSVIGWQEWPQFIRYTSTYSSQPWLISQSLMGFARLHFAANTLISPLVDSPIVKTAFLLVTYAALTFATVRVFYFTRFKEQPSSHHGNLQFGFFILTLLLALPLCHMEYYVFVLPLFWTLLTWINRTAALSPQPISLGILSLSIITYFLFTRSWPVSGEALQTLQHPPKSLLPSLYFFAACSLWGITFHLLLRNPQRKTMDAAASHT